MYCVKCGEVLQDDARTCPECGHVLKKETSSWYQKHSECLIFVVLALFIVGLLAAIAVPNWHKLQLKTRQSEGRVNLNYIVAAQFKYYRDNNRFSDNFSELGWEPCRQLQYYRFYLSDKEVWPAGSDVEVPAEYAIAFANNTCFRVVAVGNVDRDDTLDVWYIEADKDIVNVDTSMDDNTRYHKYIVNVSDDLRN